MKTLNIAHRGASGLYPENTMLAFEKAVELKCHGIETDIQLTKDNVPVIFHDEELDRATNGSGLLCNYTYKELLGLDAGKGFNGKYKGQKIPTLKEFLEFAKEKNVYINLELKNGIIPYAHMEEMVIEELYHYGLENNCILSSFNHYSMVYCKKLDKNIKTGLLYMSGLYEVENYAKTTKCDALHPLYYSVLHKEIVDGIKKAGYKINTYTVNNEAHMKALMDLEIDGIITNFPDKLAKLLNICEER